MAESQFHQWVRDVGIVEARRLATTPKMLREVNAAYEVLSDVGGDMNFVHAGFAMSSIPHRETKELIWERESGAGSKLRLESGKDKDQNDVGLPYGLIARYELLFLQTMATKTRSREVQLGDSMYNWLRAMGITPGGKTYNIIREQSRRISFCRLDFFQADSRYEGFRRGGFVRDAIMPIGEREGNEVALWRDVVYLDEVFFESLMQHSLPLSEAGVRACGPSSVALDVYIWLAYRLHCLKRPTPISWAALQAQFGPHYSRPSSFKTEFVNPLTNALRAYPEARVEVEKTGVILYPSKPPVEPRTMVSVPSLTYQTARLRLTRSKLAENPGQDSLFPEEVSENKAPKAKAP